MDVKRMHKIKSFLGLKSSQKILGCKKQKTPVKTEVF